MKLFSLLLILFLISDSSNAQQDSMMMHHHMNMKMPDDSRMQDHKKMNHEMQMTSAFSLNLPMHRDGSGTSWQPEESPSIMYMKMKGNTSMMFHGAIFLRYTSQDISKDGLRAASKWDAPNWFMFMLSQKLSNKDLLSFQSMLSLDALTEGGKGYPLLFQSGESYHDVPLVDRQHPHDLFAAIAANYTHSFSKNLDANIYFGYPGEPALGSVVFMHRISASNNPDATLGHHWQDATHITFGVGTFGLRYKIIKLEGSIFTGREPDDDRYNFDKARFDSYSYRISANPSKNFSLQFSQGFINSPEELEPEHDIVRSTASLLHSKIITPKSFIANSVIWGMNHNSSGGNLHSFLVESNLSTKHSSIYLRYEFVQKDAHELQLITLDNNPVFDINAITLGINNVLFSKYKTDLSLGAQATLNISPAPLKEIYGSTPVSAEVFLKISPSLMLH